jgi:hypothetical protein
MSREDGIDDVENENEMIYTVKKKLDGTSPLLVKSHKILEKTFDDERANKFIAPTNFG